MKIKYSVIAGALLLSASGLFAATAEEEAIAYSEARAHISPVIVSLVPSGNVGNCGFAPGVDYNVTFITLGYEENMDTYMTLYDCDGVADCGREYGSPEKVVETEWTQVSEQIHEDWSYTDTAGTIVPAYLHKFVGQFTMKATGDDGSAWTSNADGGDEVVVRWWQKAHDVEGKSVSILIGTEAARHYDANMRRIGTKTSANLNPSAENINCLDN